MRDIVIRIPSSNIILILLLRVKRMRKSIFYSPNFITLTILESLPFLAREEVAVVSICKIIFRSVFVRNGEADARSGHAGILESAAAGEVVAVKQQPDPFIPARTPWSRWNAATLTGGPPLGRWVSETRAAICDGTA